MSNRQGSSGDNQVLLRRWRDAVPNDRLAHLIKDATRGLSRAMQTRLARYNVSFGHWVFLRILWEKDGLTQRELSEEAGLMEPTTFSALTAMEKLGYIERRKLPHSRKNVYVFLTEEGRALKEKLVPFAEYINQIAVAIMNRKTSYSRVMMYAQIILQPPPIEALPLSIERK